MKRIFDALSAGIGGGEAERVVLGVNWTLVTAGPGAGLAQTPQRDTPGCKPLGDAGQLAGRTLRDLASRADTGNPMEIAIALAAVNAGTTGTASAGPMTTASTCFRI